jgi:hypothetical protein
LRIAYRTSSLEAETMTWVRCRQLIMYLVGLDQGRIDIRIMDFWSKRTKCEQDEQNSMQIPTQSI